MRLPGITFAAAALYILRFCSAAPQPLAERAGTCKAKTPKPPRTVCGQAGQLNIPPKAPAARQELDYESCRDWCFDSDDCSFFSLNSKTGLCAFYGKSPRDYSYQTNSHSKDVFYEISCFDCDKTCPADQGFNVIHNAGFDISNRYFGPWHASKPSTVQIVSPGHNSKNAISFLNDLSNYRQLCRDKLYTVQQDIKIVQLLPNPGNLQGFGAPLNIHTSLGDGEVGYGFQLNDTRLGMWRTIQFSSKSVGEDKISLTFDSQTSNGKPVFQAFLDNVVVKQVPTALKTAGGSLISNGGFETGKYAPWKVNAEANGEVFEVISPGLPGQGGEPPSKHAFRYVGTDIYDQHYETSSGSFSISQNTTAPTEAGKPYMLSFQYRAVHTTDMGVSVNDFGWSSFIDYDAGNDEQLSSKLQVFSRVFTGSGQIETLTIYFAATEDYRERNLLKVFLDNVSITKLADN